MSERQDTPPRVTSSTDQAQTNPAPPPQTNPAPPPQTNPAPPPQTNPASPPQTNPASPPQTNPAPPPQTDTVPPPDRARFNGSSRIKSDIPIEYWENKLIGKRMVAEDDPGCRNDETVCSTYALTHCKDTALNDMGCRPSDHQISLLIIIFYPAYVPVG